MGMVQVLDQWLQHLRLAFAYKAETSVITMAKGALSNCCRSGQAAEIDQALRLGSLAHAECALQNILAKLPGWSFPSWMTVESWRFYCGSVSV